MQDDDISKILEDEIVVAMGCTEPAAAALAGAKAGEVLGEDVLSAEVFVSRDMMKNAMGVSIPNSTAHGIESAVSLGLVIADSSAGLAVLTALTDGLRAKAAALCVSVSLATDVPALYVKVVAKGRKHTSIAVIAGAHDQFACISRDGEAISEEGKSFLGEDCNANPGNQALSHLTLADIVTYAENAPEPIRLLVLHAKDVNLAISYASLQDGWGLQVGRTMFREVGAVKSIDDAMRKGAALASGGSDARMGGCSRPVMINSGSGKQGITVTVPVAVLAGFLKSDETQLSTALVISELMGLVLTARKDRLSALCGAFTAAIGTACAYVHLLGGDAGAMDLAINVMVGNLSGIICDGAKNTCPLKIYSSVTAAGVAAHLALLGHAPKEESGICGSDSLASIDYLSRLTHEGMQATDRTILDIMLEKGRGE